jgi:two-component system OmpR family sensor kinase/two-component system sensor histidine kinase BaeS
VASGFQVYVTQRGQLRAANWAPLFADYYERAGGWSGVEAVLRELPTAGMPSNMTGRGQGGARRGQGDPAGGRGMMGAAGEDRLILADTAGQVLLDSEGELEGQRLPSNQLAQGVPVTAEGERAGILLVVAPQSGPSADLAEEFLAALNQGILLAAVVAGLVALLLGTLLVRQITAPVRGLQAAANAIAGGDLSQRVPAGSRDELGDLGRAFNHMAGALEGNERLRRHMMADIAHELRTPLTVIQGQVEALLDGVFPLTREQLAPIHDESLLLSRLVADLRELALAEAGQLSIERRPVDLSDLARRVAAAVEPAAEEKRVALTMEVAPQLPAISADPDRLSQVLHNLLSNALRHTPPGGHITVSVRPASTQDWQAAGMSGWQAGQSRARSASHAPTPVLVGVGDTGPGIPPEDLPYIFDRFYRADKSRSRAIGGSGLGLTIARYIVEAHGGRIWAESRPGAGTQVLFLIP